MSVLPMMPRLSRATRCSAEVGSFGGGGRLIRYAASCAVAASAVLGRIRPAESIVMKELVRFRVIPAASASERRGIHGRYLEFRLREPALPIADSSARRWLEASAASLRLMSSACSLASLERFVSSIEWYALSVPADTP